MLIDVTNPLIVFLLSLFAFGGLDDYEAVRIQTVNTQTGKTSTVLAKKTDEGYTLKEKDAKEKNNPIDFTIKPTDDDSKYTIARGNKGDTIDLSNIIQNLDDLNLSKSKKKRVHLKVKGRDQELQVVRLGDAILFRGDGDDDIFIVSGQKQEKKKK